MSKSKKDNIPVSLKNIIWHKYSIYPENKEITRCCTCLNIVLIPESIRSLNNISHDIKPIYMNGKRAIISGVGEYGHKISENNGGKVTEDNLIIQCKTCNTKQKTNNIKKEQLVYECDMIDVEYNETDTEMGENYKICQAICSSGKPCKNKPLFNRKYCHVHVTN
tara:strand:- start:501 stop:995 length:495 start_codon:yes stop_codon:yes gene_type:complete